VRSAFGATALLVVVGATGTSSASPATSPSLARPSASMSLKEAPSWVTAAIRRDHLFASDGTAGDGFGYSVAVSGDTAVVGAWGDDTPGGSDAGSAYVFWR
jgi:hypothetical protein